MKKKFIAILALIMIFLLFYFYRILFVHEKVKIVPVKRGKLVTLIYATGTVTADSIALLRSESGGIVISVAGKEGTYVSKGDEILRTDQKDELLKLQDVENQIRLARIDLSAKEKDFERKENLFKVNSITKKEYEDAIQTLDLARITLQQKMLSLDVAKVSLTNTKVIAPFSGLLVNVKANLGDYLPPNAECFELLAPSSILIEGEVDEQDLGKINKQMQSIVAFDAYPEERYEGRIVRITPRTDETTKTSKIYIKLNNRPEKLNLGMTATINIKADEKNNVLLLPKTAIVDENSQSYVFVVQNNYLKKVLLSASTQSDGQFTEIPADKLSEGTKVVDLPKSSLKDNMKVDAN
ncbi:MAG: efflux RND transporter periplasmic adaptor subunit [Bacteroidota bacterium]|nr:efflux RND transporter periplasmic adaptor subunit [Bacteroidota bacterium]MDP4190451.1 efflux RND transporter periplasmic adaptor subunit [Bacteroidota bacterium]MDP4194175.1 efflux RND transporter periplasmic adaptor subunit [Bacteroidota bacterium]